MTAVTTVQGPVASSELGICLTHEHVLNDVTSWWQATTSKGLDPEAFAAEQVRMENLWDLKYDPFGNRDNCRLDDADLAVEEIKRFAELGGATIIETTSLGIGRDLRRLKEISEQTGVHIVAGTGFYLESSHPSSIREASAQELAELIVTDLRDGEDGIRPGIIGEIGVSHQFTDAERTSLAAACIAQLATGLPMQVHLPGWFRLGDEVLDLVEKHGVDANAVVLCHMGPSGHDQPYQQRLAARGAWIQYDMVGAELFYADQGVQCPSDEDNARNIVSLLNAGHGNRVLVSSDIFLKSLLRRYGGPGYAHVLQYFAPRLERLGVGPDAIEQLLVHNPRTLFDNCEEKK
jgi:phosphotriesterase-related protein